MQPKRQPHKTSQNPRHAKGKSDALCAESAPEGATARAAPWTHVQSACTHRIWGRSDKALKTAADSVCPREGAARCVDPKSLQNKPNPRTRAACGEVLRGVKHRRRPSGSRRSADRGVGVRRRDSLPTTRGAPAPLQEKRAWQPPRETSPEAAPYPQKTC